MIEMMNALGAGNAQPPEVIVEVGSLTHEPGDLVTFTILYDHLPEGMDLYWELTGTFTEDLIEGGIMSGTIVPDGEMGEFTVTVQTLHHLTLDELRTLGLRVAPSLSQGSTIGSSELVEILYSPHPVGQQAFINPGTYSFVVPEGVTFISGVVISGGMGSSNNLYGSGGDGGNLRWRNRIPVTPGEELTIEVGDGGLMSNDFLERVGGRSAILRDTEELCMAVGGGDTAPSTPMTIVYQEGYYSNNNFIKGRWILPADAEVEIGGGNGGRGADGGSADGPGGGGGCGGYMGDGGDGVNRAYHTWSSGSGRNTTYYNGGHMGENLSGAAGGGAYYYLDTNDSHHATPGGGVGIKGRGDIGWGGLHNDPATGGRGGSGGTDADWSNVGLYGGGGRGRSSVNGVFPGAVNGGAGAVRLIWGNGREFPNTKTGDM